MSRPSVARVASVITDIGRDSVVDIEQGELDNVIRVSAPPPRRYDGSVRGTVDLQRDGWPILSERWCNGRCVRCSAPLPRSNPHPPSSISVFPC